MYLPNDQTLSVLGQIRNTLEEQATIHSGNPEDAMELYLNKILGALVDNGVEEEAAVDHIFAVSDALADKGLPSFPDEDSTQKDIAIWLGTAGTLGFEHYVLDG